FFFIFPSPPPPPLFPYTPLFRSPLPRYVALGVALVVLAVAAAGMRGRRATSVTSAPPAKNGSSSDPEVTIPVVAAVVEPATLTEDRKSTRLNSSHQIISYAVFGL